MTMRKLNIEKTFLLSGILLFSIFCIGQQRPAQERIRTLKVGFLTERLALTSEEAQQFWPIYNEHERKVESLLLRERQQFKGRLATLADMSDSEASKLLSQYMALQKEKADAQQVFVKNLDGVLSAKKIIRLLKAEEDFKKRLLQQIRKRRAGQ